MIDLLKLIPDAVSAIAVIIVVVLFLRQQEAASATMKAVTEQFTAALNSQREAVMTTIGHHLSALSEMVGAMKELEATARHTNTLVTELQAIITRHYETPKGKPE